MHKYLFPVLCAASLLAGCEVATDESTPDRASIRTAVLAGNDAQFDWCAAFEWYGDGICDDFCLAPDPDCQPQAECFVGGCSGQICSDQPGVISTCEFRPEYECFQQATCARQADGECGWTQTEELAACLDATAPQDAPVPPDFCAEGTVTSGDPSFVPSADGLECELPGVHCLSKDFSACPQFSPLPPDFCKEGTLVTGPARFITAADGLECELPSVHCLTKDFSACPQFSPLPPDFCQDGTIVAGVPSFIPSSDGLECQLPSVHCLTSDLSACPQL